MNQLTREQAEELAEEEAQDAYADSDDVSPGEATDRALLAYARVMRAYGYPTN